MGREVISVLLTLILSCGLITGCKASVKESNNQPEPATILDESEEVSIQTEVLDDYDDLEEDYRVAFNYQLPTLRLLSNGTDAIMMGDSKIGGQPDLPKGYKWPSSKGVYHSFLAQINLKQLPDSELSGLLPKEGILYFFYDSSMSRWIKEDETIETHEVIYTASTTDLQTLKYPKKLGEEYRYSESKVNITEMDSYPPYDHDVFYEMNLSDQAFDEYYDFLDSVNPEPSIHKMFGYADNIQGDMRLSCVLDELGLEWSDYRELNKDEKEKLYTMQDDWLLLYQQDSTDEMMFGDDGMVYYWIKEEDLRDRRFDKVVMEMQCY